MTEDETVRRLLNFIYYDYEKQNYSNAILQLEEVCKIFIHRYNEKERTKSTMVKVISTKMKESSMGYYVIANELIDNPVKLYIDRIEQQEGMYRDDKGKTKTRHFIYFKDVEENERLATVGLQSPLFKELSRIDPDQGDLLEIWTTKKEGTEYLDWHVEQIHDSAKVVHSEQTPPSNVNIDSIPF